MHLTHMDEVLYNEFIELIKPMFEKTSGNGKKTMLARPHIDGFLKRSIVVVFGKLGLYIWVPKQIPKGTNLCFVQLPAKLDNPRWDEAN